MTMRITHSSRASNDVTAQWHWTKRGWSRSFHKDGQRVVVFQSKPEGTFYARVGPSNRQRQISLQTTNREVAEACATDYLANPQAPIDLPLTDEIFRWRIVPKSLPASTPATITLFELICWYVGSNKFRSNNKKETQQKVMSALQILLIGLGPNTDVSLLDANTLEGYRLLRRDGGIAYSDFQQLPDGTVRPYARVTGPVKTRSVLHELIQLQAMIRWATETRPVDKRGYLLREWPMQETMLLGLKAVEKKERVGRAPLPREAIQRLLATALSLAAQARAQKDTAAAVRWTRLALTLLIVDVTGERIGGVRQLRRSDLQFVQRGAGRELKLTFRGDTLKGARQRTIPFPLKESRLVSELLVELPVIGNGLLFTNAKGMPMSTDAFIEELHELAKAAQVELTPDSVWHGARVTWATERRHLDPRP
ncbi:tyrosine-type recombinase/integrase [Gemmatimonas sp.]|uniref:tyrosine-type recombinase/integrase n=1 Tax=Gemmatimonas sp. TaxID=1962908 RepID=UPI003F703D5E